MTGERMAAGAALGDPSFEELFRLHAGRLVRLAHLLGAGDPEDVVQEAFCRFFVVHRDRRPENLVGYLNRMVVNEVRTRQRRNKLADRKRLHLVSAPPASEQVERDESVTALVRALRELSPRQREALVLRYWLDLPLADIAVAMDVRLGTAKSLVSRGISRLGQQLEDHR
ncbi:sigma-70 family RNA polymerase sigma factor [Streptomyces sp. SID13031]|uniref:RNA polymerase sigma factor n=1 Tax=Streptomyces sp. SID13031 TaxID=2706046 RepID=UPI0013C7606B|nr:sigma-70 family RNA polymerase sigma factor [Streptomyces sp. SID13031]NEA34360.1 sigma-70 family RNA polymerase sigma factor [Streptomyces sp. SID13031]